MVQVGHRVSARIRGVWRRGRVVMVVPLVGRVLVVVQRQGVRLAVERVVRMMGPKVRGRWSYEHGGRGRADVRGRRQGGR